MKKGDVLLRVESIQPGADVQAQAASIDAADAGMKAASANYDSAVATLASANPIWIKQSSIGIAPSNCTRTN